MSLREVNIEEDDFDVFLVLTPEEKIEYLWDAQSIGSTAAILKQIDKLDIFERREPEDPIMSTQEIISGDFRLTVTTFDEYIHLNSNSLKVIRQFVGKMWHDGYILSQVSSAKTVFDRHRFLRVFRIIAKHDCICEN
jgi:hypothetical protein